MLDDPGVIKELDNNSIEYQAVQEIIKARHELNLTQEQFAELVETKQSNISGLESGDYNPIIGFVSKVAQAMGKNLSSGFKNRPLPPGWGQMTLSANYFIELNHCCCGFKELQSVMLQTRSRRIQSLDNSYLSFVDVVAPIS
jgi:DNA-binding XRE family transcriptional regulator